ncbi:MAG TPA: hypothetical protein VKT54_13685 [Steroidobacteraceae bacterium]|nr:hypothetical protein [Steroidobacteraceae bacterium]
MASSPPTSSSSFPSESRAPGRLFRPTTPADAAAIAALLGEAGLHPITRPEVEQWKYWQAGRGWPGARSFTLAEGGALIAHAAIVPGVLAWGSERARIVQVVDWAARSGSAGAGVTIMKRIGQLADGMLAIGGTGHTRQILPHLGFRPAGEVTACVRTLRPLRIIGARQGGWRVLPRVARSVLWTLSAPSSGSGDFTVRRLSTDTLSQVLAALPAPSADLAVFERSEDTLRHALECPLVPMELHALERTGRVQGYFLLAIAGRQARLADCWMVTPDRADWRALIQHAVQRAGEHRGVAELVAWGSGALLTDLLECGFHARGTQPVLLMMRTGREAPAATLRVQMLDTDAAYLDPRGQSLSA